MKLVYVSGPLSADTRWETEILQNHIIEVALGLIRTGHAVIVPQWFGDHIGRNELNNGLNLRAKGRPWKLEDQVLASDCECIRRCDAIMMCKGWTESKGARIEWDIAVESGIEIMYEEGAEKYVDAKSKS